MTVQNLTTEWTRAMNAANAAAVDLLTAVRPDLQVIRYNAGDVHTSWETATHAGNLDVSNGRTVKLTVADLSARTAARITVYLHTLAGLYSLASDDRFRKITELPAGTHSLGMYGEQQDSNIGVSTTGDLILDLYGLPLEQACSVLAALELPDETPLGTCLCILPSGCRCEPDPTPTPAATTPQPPASGVPIGDEYRCGDCEVPFTVTATISVEIEPTLDADGNPRIAGNRDLPRDDMEVYCAVCNEYPDPDSDVVRKIRAAASAMA